MLVRFLRLLLVSPAIFSMAATFSDAEPSHEDLMVVAAFGTSLTNHGGWLRPLQDKLSRCLSRQVSVLDFGAGGMTSEWGVSAVDSVVQSQPSVVLIEFSVNDAAWFKGFSLQRSRDNIIKIVRAIKGARPNARIFLMTMNSTFGPRGWRRPNIDAYYDLYNLLSKELNVEFIDNRQKWKALPKSELRNAIPDGLHPLPEMASRILVPTIARAIVGTACE